MAKFLCNYVNGKWVETGRTFANINPVNGSKVCHVSEADQATVDQGREGRAGGDGQRVGEHEHRRSLRAAGRASTARWF